MGTSTRKGGLLLIPRKCCASLPVLGVTALTCFVYYTVVFLVIRDDSWSRRRRGSTLFHGLLFTCLTFMAMLSYALSIFQDPGTVPRSYVPDIEVNQHQNTPNLHQVMRKSGDQRYCQKCDLYKPARAHHCRVCKRCVLRMDHHCTWINNCVGHNNYKAFFLFVFYVVLACSYALILIANYTFDFLGDNDENRRNSTQQPVSSFVSTSALLKVVCAAILAPLTMVLIVLLGWHVYLLLNNKTTIEYHEGVRARWLAEKAGQIYRHPYNIGYFSNLVMILGPNPVSWLCPTFIGHIGSGLEFPSLHDGSATE